jgi:PAS domain S-box-containing protein
MAEVGTPLDPLSGQKVAALLSVEASPAASHPLKEIAAASLVQLAEEANPLPSEGDSRALEALRVHEAELEAQNEELRRTQEELAASQATYWNLYHLAPVGYVTLDDKGRILEANATIAAELRVERSALITQSLAQFVFPEDQVIYRQYCRQILAAQTHQNIEIRMRRRDGSAYWARLEAALVESSGYQGAVCHIIISDITERKQIEDTQLFLLQCGYSDEDFFESLARYLYESLDMIYVCIDHLTGEGLNAQTVAVYHNGRFEDNITYALKDTPCGEVVGKTICVFNRSVQHLFPKDTVLQEIGAESYVGTTLWSSKGEPIGLIALIGREPLENSRYVEYVLNLVAVRAAWELERRETEKALRASLAEKEVLLREVHHRVKNNMASILGLIALQLTAEPNPEICAKFTDLGNRVRSMALVHELLYQSDNLSSVDMQAYLGSLIAELRESLAGAAHAHLTVSAPGVTMDLDTAIPCGLIVNELVTNAFKYAFPGGTLFLGDQRCEIVVTLTPNEAGYTLTVRDNGKGLSTDWDWTTSDSLGLPLVKMLGERQLKGRIELDRVGGTTVHLHFRPLNETQV